MNTKMDMQSGNSNPPIELDALKSLFGDDFTLQKKLLKQFVSVAATDIAEMEKAVENADSEGVAFLAHKLKSPAMTVGATQLAELSRKLELASKAADWPRVLSLTSAIGPVMEEIRSFVERI